MIDWKDYLFGQGKLSKDDGWGLESLRKGIEWPWCEGNTSCGGCWNLGNELCDENRAWNHISLRLL